MNWRRTPPWFRLQPGRHGTSIFIHCISLRLRFRWPVHTLEIWTQVQMQAQGNGNFSIHFLRRRLCLRWGCSHARLLVLVLTFAPLGKKRCWKSACALVGETFAFTLVGEKKYMFGDWSCNITLIQEWTQPEPKLSISSYSLDWIQS